MKSIKSTEITNINFNMDNFISEFNFSLQKILSLIKGKGLDAVFFNFFFNEKQQIISFEKFKSSILRCLEKYNINSTSAYECTIQLIENLVSSQAYKEANNSTFDLLTDFKKLDLEKTMNENKFIKELGSMKGMSSQVNSFYLSNTLNQKAIIYSTLPLVIEPKKIPLSRLGINIPQLEEQNLAYFLKKFAPNNYKYLDKIKLHIGSFAMPSFFEKSGQKSVEFNLFTNNLTDKEKSVYIMHFSSNGEMGIQANYPIIQPGEERILENQPSICGFIKQKESPILKECEKYSVSQWILTPQKLYFFNKISQTLQEESITLELYKKLTNKFCECSKLSRIECDDIAQYVSFEPNYTQFSNYKTNSLNSSQFEELLQKNEENAPTLDNQFIGMIVYTMKEVNEQIEFKSRGIRKKSASSSHDTVGKGSILEGSKTNYIATELEVADINIYCWSPVVITSKFQFMLKNKKNITPWHEDILYLTLDKENQFVVECSFLGFSGEKITRTLDPSVAYTSPSDLDKKDFQEEILSQVGMHPQLSKKTSVYKEAVYSRLKHRASQLKNNFKEYISPISYIKIHKDLEKLDVSINLNNIPLFEHALFMFSGKTFINLPYFSSSTKVNHSSSFIDNIPCMKIEFKIKDKMKNDFIPVFNELKNFLSKQELDELILVESSVKDNVFTLHLNLTYIQANMPALQNIMNDLLKNGKSSYKKVYNEYREENINVKPALNFKTRKFKKLGLECIDDQSKKSKFLGAVLLKMFNAQHPCHFARISMYEKKIGFFAYFSLFQFDVFITEKEASVLLKNINQWIEKEESHLAKASFSKNNITHYHPLNPQLIISSEPVEKLKDGIIYLKPELNSLLSWNYSVSINDNIESGTIKLNQIKEKCRPENLELLTAIEKNKVLATLPVLSRLKHEIADVVFQAERSVFSFTLDQRILSSSTFIDTIKNILQSKPLELSSYYAKDNPISSFNINKLLLGLTSACRNHLEILAKSSSIIINEHDVITFFNLYVIGNMSLSYKDIQWLNRTDWLENQEQKTSWGFILKCIYFCNLLLAEASLKSTDSLYTIYQHTAKQLELEDSDLKISLEQWLNKEYNNLIENNTPKKIIDSL